MDKILFTDPDKQRRFEKAKELGLIKETKDADGVMRYELTQAGQHVWIHERFFGQR